MDENEKPEMLVRALRKRKYVQRGKTAAQIENKANSISDEALRGKLTTIQRGRIKSQLVKYYGKTRVEERLITCVDILSLSQMLIRMKREMEIEIEEKEKEQKEYQRKINDEHKKLSRPNGVFNFRDCEYLCSINCTQQEIAGFFQLTTAEIQSRIKQEFGINFAAYYEMHSQGIKVALRRKQFMVAMEGDTQMLKFLGKNLLGQKEKLDFDGEVKVNSWVDLMTNLAAKSEDKKDEDDEED